MSTENTIEKITEVYALENERACPFISEKGPSCPQCGADPTDVNLDEPSRTAICDKCGHKFRIPKKKK